MRVAIMQPYFFPYLGYFALIRNTDRWIVFDTAQYIRHGWVNRNRILHPTSGWQYIVVPLVRHAQSTSIQDVLASPGDKWKKRILGQLEHYKRHAPYFKTVFELVGDCLTTGETQLARINIRTMEFVCQYLEIPFRYDMFSEMDIQLGPIEKPGDWALRISQAIGASEYINPPGGQDLFDPNKFSQAGIKLTIQQFESFSYECKSYKFEPNLSVIDAMMWLSPQTIRQAFDGSLGAVPAKT